MLPKALRKAVLNTKISGDVLGKIDAVLGGGSALCTQQILAVKQNF